MPAPKACSTTMSRASPTNLEMNVKMATRLNVLASGGAPLTKGLLAGGTCGFLGSKLGGKCEGRRWHVLDPLHTLFDEVGRTFQIEGRNAEVTCRFLGDSVESWAGDGVAPAT